MDAITSTAEDHLKVIWAALEWGGSPITIKGLAERFGTTPAAASSTVKRLVRQGLLVHEPYGPILLTTAGKEQAVMMVRRHRLIETFLVERLGYSWGEVHDEAETLEHAASEKMINRIDDLLGNPRVDPHGDPIPTRSGDVTYPDGAHRLSTAIPGSYRVIRISDDSSELLDWFELSGIHMNVAVTVTGREGFETHIVVGERRLSLGVEAGDAVIVVED